MAIMALSILAKKRRSDQVRFSVPQLLPGSRERGNSGGVPRCLPAFRECGIHRTPETGDALFAEHKVQLRGAEKSPGALKKWSLRRLIKLQGADHAGQRLRGLRGHLNLDRVAERHVGGVGR